jgi:hypothetical protein
MEIHATLTTCGRMNGLHSTALWVRRSVMSVRVIHEHLRVCSALDSTSPLKGCGTRGRSRLKICTCPVIVHC